MPNIVIGGHEIQAQALKYASMLGYHNFKASRGWLIKFRQRHNISYKTIVGEGGLVNKDTVENFLNNLLPDIIKGYHPKNIFNANETAFFFKALPNRTMQYKNVDCNSTSIIKERLS